MSAPSESKSPRSSAPEIDRQPVDPRTTVLALAGDLDLASAPELKRTLHDLLGSGRTRLVLDLGCVAFMDSTALGVMVGIHRRLSEDERLAVAEPGPAVSRLFEVSGLTNSFRVFATREAAVSYVTQDTASPAHGAAAPPRRVAPPLSADAALMLGIASTAMPFAQSTEDQAERWLRALRTHGEAGGLLASLGVSEAPLGELEDETPDEPATPGDADAVATVTESASRIAASRTAAKLGTIDVLLAVIEVYGTTFYRVLSAHGVDPAELAARIAPGEPAAAES
jgi:anti-sigma B factor antagonist